MYPDGAHLTDLKEVRDLLYKMQRPAISPEVSSSPNGICNDVKHLHYCSWFILTTGNVFDFSVSGLPLIIVICRHEKDLVLFHNRGILHSVVGAFKEDQVRAFHQCNLAASDEPIGPSNDDVLQWA